MPERKRIFQEQEPKDFAVLFNNLIVIRKGARQQRECHDKSALSSRRFGDKKKVLMYHSQCDRMMNVSRVIEVEAKESSLDTNGTFAVYLPLQHKVFMWVGKKSSPQPLITLRRFFSLDGDTSDHIPKQEETVVQQQEKHETKNVAETIMEMEKKMKVDATILKERAETAEFWKALGAKRMGINEIGKGEKIKDNGKARLAVFYYDAGFLITLIGHLLQSHTNHG